MQSSNTSIVSPQGFSTATNRITDSGWGYDPMGNLNVDSGSLSTYKFDAENRMVAACTSDGPSTCTNQVGAGRTLYSYDADGRRVKKQTPGGVVTTYVYDANGQLADEYGQATVGGTQFVTVDQLGSTRVVTSSAQVVQERHDYRPFGDEILSGTVRENVTGYDSNGSVPLKFTGKERDAETGLDYFGVRYMSSAQGRFTSPDPLVWQSWQDGNKEERAKFQEFISDPQNFNLYTYGRNNPLKYNDPTGLDVEVAITFVGDVTDEEKKRIIGAVRAYLEDKNVGKVVVRDTADSSEDKRTFGQKVKDFFATDYHSITVDFAHKNPFGNDADRPNFVKAVNMMMSGEDNFGDLRKSDPAQWSNIVAWRVLHETISHAFGIGPDSDQLITIKPGDSRYGTLIEGAYGRGRSGIPGLNPADTRALQKLLVPRSRSYVP